MSDPPFVEDIAAKFTAAWEVFARTCSAAVAPEATFQAWFAHYLISQFGIDRVAREVDFGVHHVEPHWRERFTGHSVMVDVVVTRTPGINLPRRAFVDDDKTGTRRLADLAVISELKVASTQGEGLDYTEVCKDYWKLSMLLAEADRHGCDVPLAYVCILDNAQRRFRRSHLDRRLTKVPFDARVQTLFYSVSRSVGSCVTATIRSYRWSPSQSSVRVGQMNWRAFWVTFVIVGTLTTVASLRRLRLLLRRRHRRLPHRRRSAIRLQRRTLRPPHRSRDRMARRAGHSGLLSSPSRAHGGDERRSTTCGRF